MLSVDSRNSPLQFGARLIARSDRTDVSVVPSEYDELPMQRVTGSAWSLMDAEDFHRLTKKWNLTKKEVQVIRKFYESRESDELVLDVDQDTYRMRSVFDAVEKALMDRLKNEYKANPGEKMTPHFVMEQNVPGSIVALGPSNSGKSYFFAQLLTSPEWQDVHVFILSMTPPTKDRSLRKLLQERKKSRTTWLDVDLIDDDLTMEMLSNKAKGRKCFLYVDDCLDVLPENKDTSEGYARALIVRLLHKILTKGRHVGQGISCGIALHKGKQGRSTEGLWNEATNLVVFPRTKHQLYSFLVSKFHIGKRALTKIFDKLGNSRLLTFHFEAPQYCVFDKGVMLM